MNVTSQLRPTRPRRLAPAIIAVTLLALLPLAFGARDEVKPFTTGPWGTVFLNPEPGSQPAAEPVPEKKPGSLLDKMNPWKKSAPKAAPAPRPEPKSKSLFGLPRKKTTAQPAPSSESRFPLPWTSRKSDEPSRALSKPARAPKSNPITGFFTRKPKPEESQSETATVEEIRFEPRSAPEDIPPSYTEPRTRTTSQPAKETRGFLERLGWKSEGGARTDTTVVAEPEPAESGGLFSALKRKPKPEAEPVTVVVTKPEESGGLFSALKRKPEPAPEPVTIEPEPAESGGFFSALKRKPKPEAEAETEPVTVVVTEPEESGGLFSALKRKPKPEPKPAPEPEPEPESESGGLFGLFKRGPGPESEASMAETTLERESAADAAEAKADSGGFLARLKREPAPATEPAPAASFPDEPVSDAAIEAALENEPAPAPRSGGLGLFGWKRSSAAETSSTASAPAAAPVAPSRRTVDFDDEIKPIFESKCVSCHNRDTLHGRVSLESRALAFQDTPAGSIIVPGSPESSILMENIVSSRTTTKSMPPIGHRISRQERNLIYTWIKEGAHWP